MIREVAPGGTYTSAPMLVCSSVYPVLRSTNAPERDVLRRSPPTGCVVGLGYHTSAQCFTQRRCWLRLSQFSRPSCTTLAAPIFGIRQYVSPFAQYTSLGASGPSPSKEDNFHFPIRARYAS